MSTASYFKTLGQIEDRVAARMTDLRQAERDVALHCNGMALDGATAEEVYRAGLEHCGISRSETSGLSVAALRVLLKNRPSPGSSAWRDTPAMAFDSTPGERSALDGILKGIKPPRDGSHRNDFRRCL
jgi:hypothetical protein